MGRSCSVFFFSVALLHDSGSLPPQTGFQIMFTGHTTLGRTPLHEWSARSRDLYLITHNPSKRSAAELSLRRRGQWDRRSVFMPIQKLCGTRFRNASTLPFATLVSAHIVLQPCGGFILLLCGTTARSSPIIQLSFGLLEWQWHEKR